MPRSEERWAIARVAHREVPLVLACDEEGALVGVSTGGDDGHLRAHAARHAAVLGDGADGAGAAARVGLARACELFAAYLAGEIRDFDLPLRPLGTEFQQKAWEVLRRIPFGTTWSYGAQTAALGAPRGAARAVGAANGKNPLAIVIPCHRVVGGDGSLTGYAGGLAVKRWLLAHEGAGGQNLELWGRG